jgi:hypothetical protein
MASRRKPDFGASVIMENKKTFPLNSIQSLLKKIKTRKKMGNANIKSRIFDTLCFAGRIENGVIVIYNEYLGERFR